MTFQSTIPEVEILSDNEDKEKSFLYQITHSKTPKRQQQSNQQQIQEEQHSQPRRRLFQELPIKAQREFDDSMDLEDESAKPESKTKGMQAALKGYEIYKDYHVMLNLTDIGYGVKGHNKFYQIQLLTKSDSFYLFTKWGRVGAQNPQSELKDYESRIDAIQQFKRKFRDKTATEWDDRAQFKPQPGKYSIVGVVGTGQTGNINADVEKLNQRNQIISARIRSVKSTLTPEIYELMSQIWDINRMNRTLKELDFDTEKNPLGRLTSDSIQKGFKILTLISAVLRQGYKESQLVELTNQFYTNIPQSFGMRKPPIIDNYEILSKKNQLLTVLQELEIANKYINLSLAEQSQENPLDCFYRLLKARIEPLEEPEMFRKLENAIKLTHGPTHDKFRLQLVQVYSVDRKNEHIRYFPFQQFENRRLLWHGSRVTNFVGILSEGLRIAPPDAPSTGYMFGKGIYFADVCSKSAGYCHATVENPFGYMLLCEVALGKSYQVFKAQDFVRPPLNHHSVWGVGRTHCDPRKREMLGEQVLESGEVIPNEELKIRGVDSQLTYNEFVVYDVAQVRIKYLIKVKFIFA